MAEEQNQVEKEEVNEQQLSFPFETYPGTPEDYYIEQEEQKPCGCRYCRNGGSKG